MKIIAIIPARGGSKGIPKKNIKLLNGKPLLYYTAKIALESNLFDKVLLSTDDEEIAKIGQTLGLTVPFMRPSKFSQDDSTTLSVIQHAIQYLKQEEGEEYDSVCILQTTTPFRTLNFLQNAVSTFKQKKTDSLISVQEVPHQFNPHWTFVKNSDGILKIATGEKEIISRRQDLPSAYHRDGSIYLTTVDVIQNMNSLYGETISFVMSPKDLYVNIDTPEDWKKAEKIEYEKYRFLL